VFVSAVADVSPTRRTSLDVRCIGLRDGGETFRAIHLNTANAKIGVLYQNDDYGKDFLWGWKPRSVTK